MPAGKEHFVNRPDVSTQRFPGLRPGSAPHRKECVGLGLQVVGQARFILQH